MAERVLLGCYWIGDKCVGLEWDYLRIFAA